MNKRAAIIVLSIVSCWVVGNAVAESKKQTDTKEYVVPPAGSPEADASTHNVLLIIKKLRERGLRREAGALADLLKKGKVVHRVSGEDAEDDNWSYEQGALKYGYGNLNGDRKRGIKRLSENSPSDQWKIYKLLLSTLHELVHKDQSKAFFIRSKWISERFKGYTPHEIEAYRISQKKYAEHYVLRDLDSYITQKSGIKTDKQNYDRLNRLRKSLGPLRNDISLQHLRKVLVGKYGDKACRWVAINRVIRKIGAALDSMWLDSGSRVACKKHLTAALRAGRNATRLKAALKKAIAQLDARIRSNDKIAAEARHALTAARRKKERLALAEKIRRAELRGQILRRQRAALQSKKATSDPRLYRLAAAESAQRRAMGTYHACRTDYVAGFHRRYELKADQLPRDMAFRDGKIVRTRVRPPVDLAKLSKELRQLFGYSGKMMGVKGLANKNSVQTPCPKKTKTASTPKAGPKSGRPRPPAKTPGKGTALPRSKCKSGGLAGNVRCKVAKPLGR